MREDIVWEEDVLYEQEEGWRERQREGGMMEGGRTGGREQIDKRM